MIPVPLVACLCLIAGAACGAAAAWAYARPGRRAPGRLTPGRLTLAETSADTARNLAVAQSQLTSLRHDLRGILSPALLIADRLVANDDPAIRRAGEVIIRTVDRATARLVETKMEEGPSVASVE